jgi:hypothetical protein
MELGSQLGPQSRHIHPFIHIKNKEPEGYSHPHFAPQRILMGNHKMEHHQPQINTISPIVSEATIVEIWRQHVKIGVIQSLDACITTIRMEMVVAPNMDFVRKGVIIISTTKLGSRSNGILARRNLSQSSALPIATTRVVNTLQMVFTNPIITIHVK